MPTECRTVAYRERTRHACPNQTADVATVEATYLSIEINILARSIPWPYRYLGERQAWVLPHSRGVSYRRPDPEVGTRSRVVRMGSESPGVPRRWPPDRTGKALRGELCRVQQRRTAEERATWVAKKDSIGNEQSRQRPHHPRAESLGQGSGSREPRAGILGPGFPFVVGRLSQRLIRAQWPQKQRRRFGWRRLRASCAHRQACESRPMP